MSRSYKRPFSKLVNGGSKFMKKACHRKFRKMERDMIRKRQTELLPLYGKEVMEQDNIAECVMYEPDFPEYYRK